MEVNCLGVILESCLEDIAKRLGTEREVATWDKPPADVLYLRLCDLASDEAFDFPNTRNQTLLKVTWAFVILAFTHFSEVQRNAILNMYCEEDRSPLFKRPFHLAPYQKKILINIAKRVDVDIKEEDIPQNLCLTELSYLLPKRIIDTEDPKLRC